MKQKIEKKIEKKSEKNRTAESPKPGVLEVASFTCGAMVMVVEMAGSRLLAPWMGSSLIVWTSLIGIILAFLSLGYWLGGKLADKSPHAGTLAKLIFSASVSVAVLGVAANPVLSVLSGSIANIYAASVTAAIVLFSVPSVLLGMVSPMIVRIALESDSRMGATVGRFSALSCVGSILGTFLGGFVLISMFSTGTILLLTAAILAVTASLVWRKAGTVLFAAVLIGIGGWIQMAGMPMASSGIHIETQYNHIRIYDGYRYPDHRLVRVLQTDPSGSQSAMFVDAPNDHVFDYTKFYDLAFFYRPKISRALMLGGGGYSIPKYIMANFPEVEVDVVELDPGMTEVAKQYFEFTPNEKIRIFHEDARTFINREIDRKYDAVFWDVFTSEYNIPFHLTTVQAAQRVYSSLSDDGISVMNIISAADGKNGGVFKGIYAAFAEVFPYTRFFLASNPQDTTIRQNIVLIASKTPLEDIAPTEKIQALLANEWKLPITHDVQAFRDEFAPVEYHALLMR